MQQQQQIPQQLQQPIPQQGQFDQYSRQHYNGPPPVKAVTETLERTDRLLRGLHGENDPRRMYDSSNQQNIYQPGKCNNQISNLIAYKKAELINLFGKIGIKVSKKPTNKELSNIIATNLKGNKKLQIGGGKHFNIITTGLCDYIYENQDIYYHIWVEKIFPRIRTLLSKYGIDSYNIYHFDKTNQDKDIVLINKYKELEEKLPNVISTFNIEYLTFEQYIKIAFSDNRDHEFPPLIFDFAHIYKYTFEVNNVKIAGHYQEINKDEEFHLHSLYLGYLGEEQFFNIIFKSIQID
jgi:hypothetical protein